MAVCSCMCVQHDYSGQLVSATKHIHTNNVQSLVIVLHLLLLNTQTVEQKTGIVRTITCHRKVIRSLSSADKWSCSQCHLSERREKRKRRGRWSWKLVAMDWALIFTSERQRGPQPACHISSNFLGHISKCSIHCYQETSWKGNRLSSELTMPISH